MRVKYGGVTGVDGVSEAGDFVSEERGQSTKVELRNRKSVVHG